MLDANDDGSEKLRLFVIGKSKKPCFENVGMLSTIYNTNRKALMTSELLTQKCML